MKFAKNIHYLALRSMCLFFLTTMLLLFTLSSCNSTSEKATGINSKADSLIREIEREWAEVAVTGDTSVIKRILADDFLGTTPEGVLYTKQDFIDDMKAHPSAFTSNIVNEVKVRFADDVAIAQGNETFTRKTGETARFIWTDVLVERDGKWQVIAAEDLIAPAAVQSSEGLFTSPLQKDLAGVDSCRSEYVSAWLAADANRIIEVYTNDALVLYPNQPAAAGRTAIHSYFKSFFDQYRQDLFELTSEEVKVAGSFAFDHGKYKWRGTLRQGGNPINDYGKYLVILQRQTDGSWKISRDMDNSNRPLSQTTRSSN